MELQCELVTNGINRGNNNEYKSSEVKKIKSKTTDWILLLQVDSNEECNMMWIDMGRLYFWIKADDLHNEHFEKSWFCLQSY
jgi:uncharacterized protein YwqG